MWLLEWVQRSSEEGEGGGRERRRGREREGNVMPAANSEE
jgi:hypothetical protein